MRNSAKRLLIGLLLASCPVRVAPASESPVPSATTDRRLQSDQWRIYYKFMPATWWRVKEVSFYVSTTRNDVDHGMQLNIFLGFGKNGDWVPFPQGQVRPHLYHSARVPTEPSDGGLLDGPLPATIQEGCLAQVMCWFPWQTNILEEAYLNVRLGETSYGLELPYGFTDDPRSQRAATIEPRRGELRTALALPKGTQLVPWTSITWELGEIEDNCRLFVAISNRVETVVQMTLYREQNSVWDLNAPPCAVSIADPDGTQLVGRRVAQSRSEVYRRSDFFDFGRVSAESPTGWGAILIAVGERRYRVIVPRSAYALSR